MVGTKTAARTTGDSGAGTGGAVYSVNDNVSAAGTNQATATQLVGNYSTQRIQVASGSAGVKLPVVDNKSIVMIVNNTGGNPRIYPSSGQQINLITANNPLTMEAFSTMIFYGVNGTNWYSEVWFGNNTNLTAVFATKASYGIAQINLPYGGGFSIPSLGFNLNFASADGLQIIYGDGSSTIYNYLNIPGIAAALIPYLSSGLTRGKAYAMQEGRDLNENLSLNEVAF